MPVRSSPSTLAIRTAHAWPAGHKRNTPTSSTLFSSQSENGYLIMKGHRPEGDILVRPKSTSADGSAA
jgi:hypothetical protein